MELDVVELVYRPKRLGKRPRRAQWFWRYLNGENHKIMAIGGEGYDNFDDMVKAVEAVLDIQPIRIREGHQRVSRQSGWPDILIMVLK